MGYCRSAMFRLSCYISFACLTFNGHLFGFIPTRNAGLHWKQTELQKWKACYSPDLASGTQVTPRVADENVHDYVFND